MSSAASTSGARASPSGTAAAAGRGPEDVARTSASVTTGISSVSSLPSMSAASRTAREEQFVLNVRRYEAEQASHRVNHAALRIADLRVQRGDLAWREHDALRVEPAVDDRTELMASQQRLANRLAPEVPLRLRGVGQHDLAVAHTAMRGSAHPPAQLRRLASP